MIVLTVSNTCDSEFILSKVKYSKWRNSNFEIYDCTYEKKKFILVITDYGKINIGSSLQYVLCNSSVDFIIQIGTANSINNAYKIFDIFIASEAIQYDVDYTNLGYQLGVLPNETTGVYTSNFFLRKEFINSIKNYYNNYHEGIIATGESFITNCNLIAFIKKNFCADVVDNETANTAQFCFKNNIPFLSIKVISNISNAVQYDTYNEKASLLCQKIILNFIKNFQNKTL